MVDTSRILKTLGPISRLYVKNYTIHIHTPHVFLPIQTYTESKCFQIERNNALNNCCLPPLSFIRHSNGSEATILDKTVQKIVYLDSIFLKIVAVPFLPSPPSPESNVVVYSKQSLIPDRFGEATLNRGKGFSSRKGVV